MKIENPDQFWGKIIRVYFLDGQDPITGEYDGFTPEYDDPRERANIGVKPRDAVSWGYGLYEDEIERIEIIGDA